MSEISIKDDVVEDVEYLSEDQVRSFINRLVFEIEKLRDENESLWFMLEEIDQSNIDGGKAITTSLRTLKEYRSQMNKKPAEA